jgi:hypothetical protein
MNPVAHSIPVTTITAGLCNTSNRLNDPMVTNHTIVISTVGILAIINVIAITLRIVSNNCFMINVL